MVILTYENATEEQLIQVATDEDCEMDDKYKACAELQIRFVISKYRKRKLSQFDGRLSNYWISVYNSNFRGWQ